ncbi:MAG: 4Fe-4S dicluster domain-containing protein [Desulfobacterota bacterium]|nr:4Fe-4S dicluster domain-containing protein [Thermodesulfobacteriota bacterium]
MPSASISALTPAHKGCAASSTCLTRRNFLKWSGIVIIAVGAGVSPVVGRTRFPICHGYLLVDTKKCQGCMTCMLACALAHEGKHNLSRARIQVVQNPFEKYPDDTFQMQCRQCVVPACVASCPTGALHVDTASGNVRRVDTSLCNGCEQCVTACPYTPSRIVWNAAARLSQKCDLCINTPYWNETGGPSGKKACVELCPMKAIAFTTQVPEQTDTGYRTNLRDKSWAIMGYPTD